MPLAFEILCFLFFFFVVVGGSDFGCLIRVCVLSSCDSVKDFVFPGFTRKIR